MESYRIWLRSGGEEEIGPAELIEDEDRYLFHAPDGTRAIGKDEIALIEEESHDAAEPEEDGKAA
jgi:hypothetical protein